MGAKAPKAPKATTWVAKSAVATATRTKQGQNSATARAQWAYVTSASTLGLAHRNAKRRKSASASNRRRHHAGDPSDANDATPPHHARPVALRIPLFAVRTLPLPLFDSTGITGARAIDIPLPTHRLASTALQALQVDAELSPLVRRQFSLLSPDTPALSNSTNGTNGQSATVLHTEYQATTNRMLRVAVNGFFESLGVVLQVMEELDVGVLAAK
ncbi:hypothetical protein DV735_g470, partial [Chaetothyriales sp. CBS 134920]